MLRNTIFKRSSNSSKDIISVNNLNVKNIVAETITANSITGGSTGTVTETGHQTLTNKTINASNNTIINIGNDELENNLNATKLADGTVSNTEFQYINSLSSNI